MKCIYFCRNQEAPQTWSINSRHATETPGRVHIYKHPVSLGGLHSHSSLFTLNAPDKQNCLWFLSVISILTFNPFYVPLLRQTLFQMANSTNHSDFSLTIIPFFLTPLLHCLQEAQLKVLGTTVRHILSFFSIYITIACLLLWISPLNVSSPRGAHFVDLVHN